MNSVKQKENFNLPPDTVEVKEYFDYLPLGAGNIRYKITKKRGMKRISFMHLCDHIIDKDAGAWMWAHRVKNPGGRFGHIMTTMSKRRFMWCTGCKKKFPRREELELIALLKGK